MKKIYATLASAFICTMLFAQPAGWTYVQPYTVFNNTATQVIGYQLQITVNTAQFVSLGQMNAAGDDIRFGKECAGTTLFNYWIESGMNTASTIIWVKLDTLPASDSVRLYMYYGNAAATAVSAVNGTFIGPHSSTDSVASGGAGGVGNSQRGFRFAPTQDILMTHVGKREPTGTTRTVTLFNFATQAIVTQQTVGGPAGQYSYNPLAQPVWLTGGTQYVLELFQGASDGYYFGTSSQIGQHLTYYDMRYCNSCTQNTFPTNVLSNYHYGYPDMWYWTKLSVAIAPTVTVGVPPSGSLATSTPGTASVCPNDSVAISVAVGSGAAPFSYQWIPTTGVANPNAGSTMVLPPTSGMYYVMVTDACGASNLDSMYVTINTPPTITASVNTDSVCMGGSFIATGSGAVTYSWSGGVTDGVPFMPTVTDNYTVTGTDMNGCTNIAIATVTVMNNPTVTANVTAATTCLGDSTVLSGSGASAYSWDNGVTDLVPFVPASTMMYHVTGTDIYGCSGMDSIMITVNNPPAISISSSGSPYCAGSGGSAMLMGNGVADIFTWMPGPQTGSTITVMPNVTTTYTVQAVDTTTNCASYDSVQVVVHPTPDLTATGGAACIGDCVQLNANVVGGTPAYTYNWIPSGSLSSPTIANPLACNTVTTCYTVIVTDANLCADTAVTCAQWDPLPVVTATGPSTVCVTDGSYTLTGSPAGGLFTGPGVSGTSFSPASAGNGTHFIMYSFTDSSGCGNSDTLAIVVSPCVGIADNNPADGIDVYPNPFGSTLILNLSEATNHVRITNSLGELVFDQKMNAGRNEINTEQFAAGVYFLEVSTANGTSVVKVMKQ